MELGDFDDDGRGAQRYKEEVVVDGGVVKFFDIVYNVYSTGCPAQRETHVGWLADASLGDAENMVLDMYTNAVAAVWWPMHHTFTSRVLLIGTQPNHASV